MNNTWVLISIFISFLVTCLVSLKFIPYLIKLKYGQTILDIGPSWHKEKQGTPTMGGIIFIFGIYVSIIICLPLYYFFVVKNDLKFQEPPLMFLKIISGLFMALAYGSIGFLDDYIKVVKKRNLGLTAIQKLLLQFFAAGSYLLSVYCAKSIYADVSASSTLIPFWGNLDIGIFYWPLAAILIVGMVNAVNLTDGIDGLCTSVTFFSAIFFMLIASMFSFFNLSIVIGALIGGCFGFLVFNIHPAKVFMGDTGSLFLGGFLCAIAFTLEVPVLLPLIGIVYIIEMFSVMIQVGYFKLTKGKRLFKMSPLHHHFELCGWSEMKLCAVFDIVTIIFGIIACACVFLGC